MLELEGRAAVITGAASGIGRALALEAGARRMAVAIADVNAEGLAQTEAMLRERQVTTLARTVDVCDAGAVEAFAEACLATFPSIATVWANAGISRYGTAIRPDLSDWNLVFDVNLRGPVHCMAAFVPRLIERAEPAQFIITGSMASFMVAPEIGAYAATKHALWAIADTLRIELAQEGSAVEASLLAPPRVGTPIIATTMARVRAAQGEEGLEAFLKTLPTPADIARFAMDGAEARNFLILPNYDIGAIVAERVRPLV